MVRFCVFACGVTCGRHERLSSCAPTEPQTGEWAKADPYKAGLCLSVITITGMERGVWGGGRHMIPLTLILTQIAAIPGTDLGQIRPRFDPVSDSIVFEFANEPAVGSPIRSN